MSNTELSLQTGNNHQERVELRNDGGYVYLILEPDQQNKWLYYKWRGFLLTDELVSGYNTILEMLTKEKFTHILADHSSIVGPWNEVNTWLINEWTPRANEAGLKFFAVHTASDLFSNISLELFLNNNTHQRFVSHVFDKLDDARLWLQGQKNHA
jgi:hypothetical protein